MKKIIVPIADGFEEIETMTVVDVLRRAGAEVTLAGVRAEALKGSRGVQVLPDTEISGQETGLDMIVIPGGQPGVDHLRGDARVLGLLKKMKQDGKWIGSICAGILVLRDAELTEGLRFTCYPGFETQVDNGEFNPARVVQHGYFITSRGPGTAMEFALKLVEALYGEDKAEELFEQVLALKEASTGR